MRASSVRLLGMLPAVLFVLVVVNIVHAIVGGGAYAMGYQFAGGVRGVRAYIWTGAPPNGQLVTGSPVGICQTSVCSGDNGKAIETGWVKGTSLGLGDALRQYYAFRDTNNSWKFNVVNPVLGNNTWYQFKVLYSHSAARWEVWRGNDVVWFAPHSLGWTFGNWTAMGSEAANPGNWMGVSSWHPEYKVGSGSWTLFNYWFSQTAGQGCIIPSYDFGYHAWGPC